MKRKTFRLILTPELFHRQKSVDVGRKFSIRFLLIKRGIQWPIKSLKHSFGKKLLPFIFILNRVRFRKKYFQKQTFFWLNKQARKTIYVKDTVLMFFLHIMNIF